VRLNRGPSALLLTVLMLAAVTGLLVILLKPNGDSRATTPTPLASHQAGPTGVPEGALLLKHGGRGGELLFGGSRSDLDLPVVYDLSPDGSRVVGATGISELSGLYRQIELLVTDVHTGETSVVRRAGRTESLHLPMWSPDGAQLAFLLSVYAADPSRVHPGPDPAEQLACVLVIATRSERCFTEPQPVWSLDWSPDGQSLLVEVPRHDHIQSIDLATGRSLVLLESQGSTSIRARLRNAGHGRPTQFVTPTWSPSGRYIAAAAKMVDGDAAYVPVIFEPNGRLVALGRPSTEFISWRWAQTDDVLAYTTGRAPYRTTGVYVLDPATGESANVKAFRGGPIVLGLQWSPSDRWFAIAQWGTSDGLQFVDVASMTITRRMPLPGGASEPAGWGP
jgi:Tol biopolymer transport system component